LIQPTPDFGAESGRSAEEGESMSKATYRLKLPTSMKKAAQRLAKEDGLSLNQGIAVAVAKKVGVSETAAGFFKWAKRVV
jgi:predicted HicB family RNase H-like nuclease